MQEQKIKEKTNMEKLLHQQKLILAAAIHAAHLLLNHLIINIRKNKRLKKK